MRRDRAAYMREYRARRRIATDVIFRVAEDDAREVVRLEVRVQELEAEVRHLKAELAARPPRVVLPTLDRFGAPRPAPKSRSR